jgi:hypothetical protein
MLLGDPMRHFHQATAAFAATHPNFHFHYVTARQLVNIVHAAESGNSGNPSNYRDFQFRSRPEKRPLGLTD